MQIKIFSPLLAVFLTVLTLSLTSCEMETHSNGQLDGFWQLHSIDTIASGKTVNMVSKRRFWSFQAKLLKTSDYTGTSATILLRFQHDGDTLRLYDPVKYKATITDPDGMDTPLTDPSLLLPYGIPSLSSSFRILTLSSEWMILESNEGIRIRFRKF